jgi:hypothetical protein
VIRKAEHAPVVDLGHRTSSASTSPPVGRSRPAAIRPRTGLLRSASRAVLLEVLLHLDDQLSGDAREDLIPHHLARGAVVGDRVFEGFARCLLLIEMSEHLLDLLCVGMVRTQEEPEVFQQRYEDLSGCLVLAFGGKKSTDATAEFDRRLGSVALLGPHDIEDIAVLPKRGSGLAKLGTAVGCLATAVDHIASRRAFAALVGGCQGVELR